MAWRKLNKENINEEFPGEWEMLREGTFGETFKAKQRETENFFAIRRYSEDNNASLNAFEAELKAHKTIGKHKNVANLHACYEDDFGCYITFEFSKEGSLSTIFEKKSFYTEEDVREIIKQVAEGLQHCLNKNIVHRNLTPETVLVRSWDPIDVALTDFKVSRADTKLVSSDSEARKESRYRGLIAPEVIENEETRTYNRGKIVVKKARARDKKPSYKSDVYSLGMIAFMLLSGTKSPPPLNYEKVEAKPKKSVGSQDGRSNSIFSNFSSMTISTKGTAKSSKSRKKNGLFAPKLAEEVILHPEERWICVSDEAKHLVTRMVRKYYRRRPSYKRILQHDLMKQVYGRRAMPLFETGDWQENV